MRLPPIVAEPDRLSKKGVLRRAALCVALLLIVSGSAAYGQSASGGRTRTASLPQGLEWLNTAGPIELSDLRGKFVLLDFWTYCCINCMHILPELEKLEAKYPNNLVVIGVHSAKFQTEQDTANIAEAILRYDIKHPVVNDANHRVWNQFKVTAWPSVRLLDPEGYEIWRHAGEITFEQVDAVLRKSLVAHRKRDTLDESPLRFELEEYDREPTPLRFPGKVLADARSGRLFIADSGHNRIVVTSLDGELLGTIGSGVQGRDDGDFSTAQFNDPQGMAVQGETLYVADTMNHLIRRVDLTDKTVTTIAGTGKQRRKPAASSATTPRRTDLASPWALWIHGDAMFIAMAGSHQIWVMRLNGSDIRPFAGNQREDIVDGPLLPRQPYQMGFSSFAQPSGLTSDGKWLYVADSEGSSIRAVPLTAGFGVRTVVGTSKLPRARLFTFGDVDGRPPGVVLLQHALGITLHGGMLMVADTYNNKIKRIDPASGETTTLVGSKEPGSSDEPAQFDEPAGISVAGSKLYVADTNNHAIRIIDLARNNAVFTMEIPGLTPPDIEPDTEALASLPAEGETTLEPVRVRPDEDGLLLEFDLRLPEGHKLNALATPRYTVTSLDAPTVTHPVDVAGLEQWQEIKEPTEPLGVRLPLNAASGRDYLRIGLTFYYCREGAEAVCKIGTAAWKVPIELADDAEMQSIRLEHEVLW